MFGFALERTWTLQQSINPGAIARGFRGNDAPLSTAGRQKRAAAVPATPQIRHRRYQ
jgi:hypothetical protein